MKIGDKVIIDSTDFPRHNDKWGIVQDITSQGGSHEYVRYWIAIEGDTSVLLPYDEKELEVKNAD